MGAVSELALEEELNNFDNFWLKVTKNAEKNDVNEPILIRQRRRT